VCLHACTHKCTHELTHEHHVIHNVVMYVGLADTYHGDSRASQLWFLKLYQTMHYVFLLALPVSQAHAMVCVCVCARARVRVWVFCAHACHKTCACVHVSQRACVLAS